MMSKTYKIGKTEIAICGIVIMELFALSKGIDGVMLSTAIASVAAISGYALSEKLR